MFDLNTYQKSSICLTLGCSLLTINYFNKNNLNNKEISSLFLINLGNYYNILDAFSQ